MVKRKNYSTTGLTWLEYSIIAFNGTHYPDRSSPETFVESYILYNRWKNRPQAVELANQYYAPAIALAEHLLENSEGAGMPMSNKQIAKFEEFKKSIKE